MSTEARDVWAGERPSTPSRYEIITPLGSGGMARVFLALSKGPFGATKLVVVKELRAEVAEDDEVVAQFVDEGRIAVRLSHRNVVHTYEVVAGPGKYFIVMEFLEGHSLSEILRRVGRASMPLPEHLWILSEVLAGLQYAHELRDFDGSPLQIVHRDVSPSNVLVTYGGEVKLLDFGIAKAAGALSSTQNGIVKGKVGYAAPEQLIAGVIDARADIYAVGVMLWEAMARQRRSKGDTYLARMQARIKGAELEIGDVWSGVPPELEAISRRALSFLPGQRYQTALEFKHELDGYLSTLGAPVGATALQELMTRHFHDDSAALWHNIATSIGAIAKSARPEPTPSSDAPSSGAIPTTQRRRYVVAAWLAAGILVFAGLLGNRMRRPPQTVTPPTATSIGGASGVVASRDRAGGQSAREPAGESAHLGERVRVQISIVPRSATALLDGRPLAVNPYSGFAAMDDGNHEIGGSAPGYETARRLVSFAHDADITIRLVPSGSRRKREDVASKPLSGAATLVRSGAALAESPPPPATNRVLPGTDLRQLGSVKTTRSIDEKDPYSP